ncbi:hypothetical protein LJB84_00615 [Bacteroidales bacterium OttesenSCG-928-J19]|nr:hypothetical protein [Bacteroidales bacterium OttesenSCG-928-J19]
MKKNVLGVLCIFLGLFLVAYNLNVVPYKLYQLIISWQSLLVGIGFILLFDKNRGTKEGGAILIIIGLLFLLPKVFFLPNIRTFIWPAIIIGVGMIFLLKSNKKKNNHQQVFNFDKKNEDPDSFRMVEEEPVKSEKSHRDSGFIKREFFFSGTKEKWRYPNLHRIEIEAAFSGVEIDLSQIEFDPNAESIHIKVSSVFSGVTLFIPSDWNLIIQKTGVFGGFTDRRPNYYEQEFAGKPVILELEAVFGGGELKYYE